jgi:hypothetical protein
MKQLQKSACYVCCGGSERQEVGETWIYNLKNEVTVHAMKSYRRRAGLVPLILNPGERAPGVYSLGGWVDLRAGVDAVEKRQITFPCRDSNCDSSVLYPLASRYSGPRLGSTGSYNWYAVLEKEGKESG